MSQQRRKFDKEFKLMAVELSKSRDNIHELAKELGIGPALIYRWRSELLDKAEGSFPGRGKPRHTQEEAESFFKTLKTECMCGNRFENRQTAAMEIFQLVEIWYNRMRLHSSLGYRAPVQMEELLNQQTIAASPLVHFFVASPHQKT